MAAENHPLAFLWNNPGFIFFDESLKKLDHAVGLDFEFPFEKGQGWAEWDVQIRPFWTAHFWPLMIAGLLYVPIQFMLESVMANRQAFSLKWPLRLWNVAICLFSVLGTIGCLHVYVSRAGVTQWHEMVCSRDCYEFASIGGRWVFWFSLSKIFEWIDTLFLRLRKRPVPFLHWYHHVITFFFVWHNQTIVHMFNCSAFLFAAMNYFVHSVMYFYYAVRSFGYSPKGVDMPITMLQILQMVLGVAILYTTWNCESGIDPPLFWFGFLMYASFFYLFVEIFYNRYFGPKKSKSKPKQS